MKYRPDWQPRFLCFAETRDIALVGAASGVAEGFIDLPTLPAAAARRGRGRSAAAERAAAAADRAGPGAAAPPTGSADGCPSRSGSGWPSASGCSPTGSTRTRRRSGRAGCAALSSRLGTRRPAIAGRVLAVRDFGGVIFVKLRDWSGDAQLMLTRDADRRRRRWTGFRRIVDLGDHVGARRAPWSLSRSGSSRWR